MTILCGSLHVMSSSNNIIVTTTNLIHSIQQVTSVRSMVTLHQIQLEMNSSQLICNITIENNLTVLDIKTQLSKNK